MKVKSFSQDHVSSPETTRLICKSHIFLTTSIFYLREIIRPIAATSSWKLSSISSTYIEHFVQVQACKWAHPIRYEHQSIKLAPRGDGITVGRQKYKIKYPRFDPPILVYLQDLFFQMKCRSADYWTSGLSIIYVFRFIFIEWEL